MANLMEPIYFTPPPIRGRFVLGLWKDDPSAPAAPDPVATANAQTASNVDTAVANATLNRVNQYTPWGSQTYTQGTPDANGVAQWTSNITLSPAQQSLLDSSNQISQSMADLGQKQIGTVSNALANPLDFSGATAIKNDPLSSSVYGGDLQRSINTSNLPSLVTDAGSAGTSSGVSRNGVTPLVGGDKLWDAMQQAQNATYGQQTSRLDPTWNQQAHDLENKLIQQGVMQNSDAWNRAMDDFGRNRNDAYQTAWNNAVSNGNAAEAQLYGQGLSSNQNAFSQNLADANLTNQAAQINNQQALANAALANNANNQQYNQNLANATFANAAQNQSYNQGLMNAQLANSAAGQDFSQSLATRNQDINELLQQQQNPLNVLNALRTGSQVTAPTFGTAPQTSVAGTNIAGLAQQNYANQMSGYNTQVQSDNSMMNGLMNLGGMAMLATKLSDRRLKRNIRRIGTHHTGIGIYSYEYVWGQPDIGVMADEVEQIMPDAVVKHASGYKMVDYGRLA